MIDKIIKRIIRAAIESFPIDEEKKEDILRSMMKKKSMRGAENDVL